LIVDVLPQRVDPPAEVIDAFNDVQRAEQDAEKEINQAEAYRSDIVPRARGEAEKIKLDADAYKEQAVREAEGEAQGFIQVYNAYKASSDLTSKRMYIETMQEILKNSSKVYVDGKAGNNVLPFLPLQDMMKRPAPSNKEPEIN
jgi:membrane protease subunit HflK